MSFHVDVVNTCKFLQVPRGQNIHNYFLFVCLFLAASGLCCGMCILRLRRAGVSLVVLRWLCSLRHAGSLVEEHGLSSCGARA